MTTNATQSEDWVYAPYGASKQLAHDMSAVASGIGRALGIGG